MAPYTFTFEEIGVNVLFGAGVIGRPRRLPTKNGCTPAGDCWAIDAPAPRPMANAVAAIDVCRLMVFDSSSSIVMVFCKIRAIPSHYSGRRELVGSGSGNVSSDKVR
jgi:hypothetical protein